MLIDAHQHVWRLAHPWHVWPDAGLPVIHRDFDVAELALLLTENGVTGTVLVQSQPSEAETRWLLSLAGAMPCVLGVVGWVDMLAPDAPARIAELAAYPKLRGLRPMLQDLPPDWILRPAAAPALAAMAARGIVLDALIRPAHLAAIDTLAARYPDLAIVIDHAAKPAIADGVRTPWFEGLAALAARPHLSCKLSGLVTEAGARWQDADLAPYVTDILSLFGPDRVIWGSDWPVLLLQTDYPAWLAAARRLVPTGDHPLVFGRNAARLYRLTLAD